MSNDEDTEKKNLETLRQKIQSSKIAYERSASEAFGDVDNTVFEWSAVSAAKPKPGVRKAEDKLYKPLSKIEFSGKKLEDGNFAGENLENANFSCADLSGTDLSGANLRGVDFSGSNLSDANLSGADLTGAVLSGAVLKNTNFTGANLSGIKFEDIDIEGAILLDIKIDDWALEDFQTLIEFLAKYYPHKLNLTLLNLTLLDLSRIDLSKVDLRGVDFTGCNLTGVDLWGLDLSQCIITPEQIAQALGRVPTPAEMKMLLAPKNKAKRKGWNIDFEDFFNNRKEFGVIDTTKMKGTKISDMMKMGQKLMQKMGYGQAPEPTDAEIVAEIQKEKADKEKSHNAELREVIEARKREALEQMKQEKEKKKEYVPEPSREEKKLEKEVQPREKEVKEKKKVRIKGQEFDAATIGRIKSSMGNTRS